MGLIRAEQARLVQSRRERKEKMKDSIAIYNAAQRYRHAPSGKQSEVLAAYDDLLETIRKEDMRELPDISVLLKSTQSLSEVDLSWAKEVIDTECNLRRDKQMEQVRYNQQQQVRAVPRISEYERTPDAVTPSGTKIWTDDNRQVENVEMAGIGQVDPNYKTAGTGISDSLQKNIRENYKDLYVSDSGATSSHVPLRYDLIPRSLIEIAAKRYTDGAVKHGERGYQNGLEDWDFILNRINHITEHWNKLFHRADDVDEVESPRDHLGAILWGIGFLCELTDHEKGKYILGKILELGRIRRV